MLRSAKAGQTTQSLNNAIISTTFLKTGPSWDWEANFSAITGWISEGTYFTVNTGTSVIDYDGTRSTVLEGLYFDIANYIGASISETEWIMRMTINLTTLTQGNVNAYTSFVISDVITNNVNTTQDAIGLLLYIPASAGTNEFYGVGVDNGALTSGQVFADVPTVETIYVQSVRNSATLCTIGIYSDSDYTTLVEAEAITIVSTIDGLQYFKMTNLLNASGSGTAVIDGTVSKIQFKNGSTVPP